MTTETASKLLDASGAIESCPSSNYMIERRVNIFVHKYKPIAGIQHYSIRRYRADSHYSRGDAVQQHLVRTHTATRTQSRFNSESATSRPLAPVAPAPKNVGRIYEILMCAAREPRCGYDGDDEHEHNFDRYTRSTCVRIL